MSLSGPVSQALMTMLDEREVALSVLAKISNLESGDDFEKALVYKLIDKMIAVNRLQAGSHVSSDFLKESLNANCAEMMRRLGTFLGTDMLVYAMRDEKGSYGGTAAAVRLKAVLILAYDLHLRFPKKAIPIRSY